MKLAEFLSDEIDFAAYMADTDAKANVKPAKNYINALKDRLHARAKQRFVYLPWEKTQASFDFRYGEVTVWGGQNGHGKSHLSRLAALSMMGQGERVCVANFEAKPVVTLQAMARMSIGENPFHPAFATPQGICDLARLYDSFGSWTDGKLWLYDQMGTTTMERTLGMVKYCAKELNIRQIFIDNLAKCVKGEDDYNGQKEFMEQVTSIARDFDVHIHVLAHIKKLSKESDLPDKHDVKGSGAIVDQPDNLLLIWRNKPKEDARKVGASNKDDEPDCVLRCRKQRNYEGIADGEPTISLWLDRESGQFVGMAHSSQLIFTNPYPHR